MNTDHIRLMFANKLRNEQFVIDKSGCKMLEICGASFDADQESIFGTPNQDYIDRELLWYESQSLNVNDIPGGPPKIWQEVADEDGFINSNYGWCIFSEDNIDQYRNVLSELLINRHSRRAVMIYTRPMMWFDYNYNGCSDFMCTNTVQYLIRGDQLHAVVQMRSNDAWAGYRNDFAWQKHILYMLAQNLDIDVGTITWQTGSLHVYERQFYLVDHYLETGNITITKAEYKELYPTSQWND